MYQQVILPRIRQQRILHDASLELTYGCNLDCFYCYNDRDKPGQLLSLPQYRVLLQDLAEMQTLYLMLTGGEPMLHPHFFEIGSMARELGFVTRVRTNGHSLGRRNAQRLYREVDPYVVELSLHGASAETHDRQTRVPGSFARLVQNIGHATAAGLRCSIVCTPTAWNEHQIDDMFALCDSLGVPLRFQGPVAPRDNGDLEPLAIQPSKNVWETVKQGLDARRPTAAPASPILNNDIPDIGEDPPATCNVGVAGVDIDPYGNVQACMHLQRSAGSLHEHSIGEIWHKSPLFLEARARAIDAAKRLQGRPLDQLGAPLHCIAVEENCNKGCGGNATHAAANKGVELIQSVTLK